MRADKREVFGFRGGGSGTVRRDYTRVVNTEIELWSQVKGLFHLNCVVDIYRNSII